MKSLEKGPWTSGPGPRGGLIGSQHSETPLAIEFKVGG
jgi:hypothetical protein